MDPQDKEVLLQAAAILHEYRERSGADEALVSLGAVASGRGCSVESVTAKIWALGQEWSGNAVNFEDAVSIARSKVKDEKERRRSKLERAS